MLRFLSKTIDRCFAVAGAFAFVQLPLLMQQYTMVLSGHLAEARREMNMLQNAASLSNKSLQEYIQKFLGQTDLDFVHQGQLMQALQARYEELSATYTSLQGASVYSRPFVFMSNIDMGVFWDTVHDFTPGLSLNVESITYAVVGLLAGTLLYKLFAKLFSLILPKKKNGAPRAGS